MLPTPIQNMANSNTASSSTGSTDDSTNMDRQNRGTGFTNIDRILGANQGAGQKIGQSLGASLTGQANTVKAGVEGAQNTFNTGYNQANNAAEGSINAAQSYARQAGETDQQYADRIGGGSAIPNTLNNGVVSGGSLTADTSSGSNSSTATPNTNTSATNTATPNYQQIGQNLTNAAYNGPTGLTNSDQLTQQAANVAALGNLANTQGGQSQLLSSFVAKPGNYSQGQNALDSLLLGQGGQQYVQQGGAATRQVGQLANQASLNATNQANAAQSAVNTNKANTLQNLQNSLSGSGTVDATGNPTGITGIETSAQNQATQFNNNTIRLQQLLNGQNADGTAITSANMSDSDKALLGNLSQFGGLSSLNNLYVDPNNKSSINNVLGSIAGNLNTNGGTYYYQGNQQQAAENLSNILGQTDTASAIAGQTPFNTNILASSSTPALNNLITNLQNPALAAGQQSIQNNVNNLKYDYDQNWNGYQNLINSITSGNTPVAGGLSSKYTQDQINDATNLIKQFQNTTGVNLTGNDYGHSIYQGPTDLTGVNSFNNLLQQGINNINTNAQNQINSNSVNLQNAILQRLANGS